MNEEGGEKRVQGRGVAHGGDVGRGIAVGDSAADPHPQVDEQVERRPQHRRADRSEVDVAAREGLAHVEEGLLEQAQRVGILIVEVLVVVTEEEVPIEDGGAEVDEVLDLVGSAQPRGDEGKGGEEDQDEEAAPRHRLLPPTIRAS